jgi:hypothetical protein
MTDEDVAAVIAQNRKMYHRLREVEQELRKVRIVMKDAALEAGDISEFIGQGMTLRAATYATALQRKLDVERSGGPLV